MKMPIIALRFSPLWRWSMARLTEHQFADERWLQPQMQALTAKVELETSAEIVARAPGSMPARVEVELDGGEQLVSECLYPPGHSFPERGLDRDVTVRKFHDVTDGLLRRARRTTSLSALARRRTRPIGFRLSSISCARHNQELMGSA